MRIRDKPLPYSIWGKEYIDIETIQQMDNALRLPIAISGALMPDAHVGYGLPIGGVLATKGEVIPYAVGVDIACRMRLSLFPISSNIISQKTGQFHKALQEHTRFGIGRKGEWSSTEHVDHEIMDDADWNSTKYLQSLKDTAYRQLGTSGTGNHFVEWGSFILKQDDTQLGLSAGEYLALLSHSGSRGVGYKIADRYSRIAMDLHTNLDKTLRYLSWLSMDSEAGQEYWLSMQLAGRFAAANHEVIHRRLAKATGLKPISVVENHHNFAWKMRLPASDNHAQSEYEVIIHRKGATPAEQGALAVIPGSMADPGYVVRGRGVLASLYSAAHGAGRILGRKAAKQRLTKTQRDRYLKDQQVTLIGGGLDESPRAYKSIDSVMEPQVDLVEVIGRFQPRIVRMAED
jgi:tRNA-splicing ligase RtcB